MLYHSDTGEAALRALQSASSGLTDSQVQERKAEFGENILNERPRKTTLQRFADQFKDAMIVILLLAAVVSFIVACVERDPKELFEPVLILLIVVLDAMTDAELDDQVENIAVYARVSPENKIRIVKAWQRKGQVVAMTGDGVNDAPALKAADIGCAMGITGTDVAKGAADMTLTDDNFATIVDAVREGRCIYANIRKVVGFLLGTNIGEVVSVFMAMIRWHKVPLLSMQLLWINLVTDSLPAIALGMEPMEADVMDHPPKPKEEGLFAHGLGLRIILQGLMFGVLSLVAFWLGESSTGLVTGGQTMAFMVLALSQTIHAFNLCSHRSIFKIGLFGNRNLNWAVLASVALVCLLLFTPAGIMFGLMTLPMNLYLKGFALILVPTVIMEVCKAVAGWVRRKS